MVEPVTTVGEGTAAFREWGKNEIRWAKGDRLILFKVCINEFFTLSAERRDISYSADRFKAKMLQLIFTVELPRNVSSGPVLRGIAVLIKCCEYYRGAVVS